MARNIEIKAKIESCAQLEQKLTEQGLERTDVLVQDDTFFICNNGRLKLREFSDRAAELIFYRRADSAGPKESFYLRTSIPDADSFRESLALAYGIHGRVKKQRHLYFVGRTRVHVDRVEELGDFLELEVVMQDEEPNETGVEEAHRLLQQLDVQESQLVEAAYVDLLAARDGQGHE